jgi:hypothetical protein
MASSPCRQVASMVEAPMTTTNTAVGWRRSVVLLETRLALWWIRPRHKTVDDHGQYDQRQAPCPVVSPVPGSQKAEVESGLNNSHRHPVLWPTRFAYDVPIRSMPSRWDVPSIPTQTHKAINNVRSVEPWELAKVTESRAKKEEVLALEIFGPRNIERVACHSPYHSRSNGALTLARKPPPSRDAQAARLIGPAFGNEKDRRLEHDTRVGSATWP